MPRTLSIEEEAYLDNLHKEMAVLTELRYSTANGQITMLPQELLMGIIKAHALICDELVLGVSPILTLPQVCRELRQLLGPLTVSCARMALLITGTFALLRPIKSEIVGGTIPVARRRLSDTCQTGAGVPKNSRAQYLWRHMRILASKTLIDLEHTEVGAIRGLDPADYQAFAVRSVAQKSAFNELRSSAHRAYKSMYEANSCLRRMLGRGFYKGTYDDPCRVGATKSAKELMDIVIKARKTISDDLKAMQAMNRSHALRLKIPPMFEHEAGEKRLLIFLTSHVQFNKGCNV